MSKWPKVQIDECARVVSGATPRTTRPEYWDGDVSWTTPKDLSDLKSAYLDRTPRTITSAGLRSCSAEVLPPGSVLFSSRAPIGHVAINRIPVATNQGFKSFVPNVDKLDAKYLYHWLRANRHYLEGLGNGATFKEVSKSVVSHIKIPLPKLPEQRRIAATLDKADALRAKRRRTLEVLDQFAQSIFLEMFGDPISNSKGWDRHRFDSLLDSIDSGWSPKCLGRPANNDEWGVLKLGAVTWCRYNENENKALPLDMRSDPALEVQAGDLLFSRKNTSELVAACAFVHETRPQLMMSDLIFRFRLKDDAPILPFYLHQLLINPRKRRSIQELASGSAGSMPNISKRRLRSLEIETPPLPLQVTFQNLLIDVERQRTILENSLDQLNILFSSLQQRAFRGEL